MHKNISRIPRRNFYVIGFVVGFLLLAGVYSFFFKQTVLYRQARFFLGTVVRVDICATRHEKEKVSEAFEAVWQRFSDIDHRMSLYRPDSDLARINRSYPHPVQVSWDVYEVIALAKELSRKTYGAFDITTKPLSVLWAESEQKGQVPTQDEIKGILKSVGIDNIKLTEDFYVQLLDPYTRLDLNAIAQGYAADETARLLNEREIRSFLVDSGGEIFAQGRNAQGRPWTIGIRDPHSSEDFLDRIALDGQGVSTSGGYEKYFYIQEKKYSHLIDPQTGYPVEHTLSVTVVAPTAVEADAYSTAMSVLDPEVSVALADRLNRLIGVLILTQDPDGNLQRYQNRYDALSCFKKQR